MSWLSLSSLSMFSTVAYELISKKLIGHEDDNHPVAFASALFFVSSIFLLFAYIFLGVRSADFISLFDLNTFGLLSLNIILYSLAPSLYYTALQKTPLSIMTIIYSFVTILTLVIEWFFGFGVITLLNLSGCLFIITSIAMVSLKSGEIRFSRNHLLIFGATILYAFAAVLDRQLTERFSHTFYGFITFIIPAFLILIINRVPKKAIKKQYEVGKLLGISLNALFIVTSFLLIFRAYSSGGTANQVSSITSLSVIATVLLSALFLNERKHLPLKLFAALVASLGVYLISI